MLRKITSASAVIVITTITTDIYSLMRSVSETALQLPELILNDSFHSPVIVIRSPSILQERFS